MTSLLTSVDLGKSFCTCRFWQITAISRINENPKDYCHYWLTMEAYRSTYMHSLNPIPGQDLLEKSHYNRPLAPKIKRNPGP
ncbi:hypothetical protein Ahy_A07g035298 [Arachis hypogaea]|uniref:Uncharacterized protein n=1 Tax=Arachis hypogaea TaxID=3818 RepID=A0A445CDK1_ARAHY|nr:hypothetical protein Ahy_A07g035298 [Arachis hypogaea]